jgi:hypothetical protein
VLGNKAAEEARLGAPEPHGMLISSQSTTLFRWSEKLPPEVVAAEFDMQAAAACVFGRRKWESTKAGGNGRCE